MKKNENLNKFQKAFDRLKQQSPKLFHRLFTARENFLALIFLIPLFLPMPDRLHL